MRKSKFFYIFFFFFFIFITGCGEQTELTNALNLVNSSIPQETYERLYFVESYQGVTITYESDNPEVLSNTGLIVRGSEDVIVTVKVTLTYKKETLNKEYLVIVRAREENPELDNAINIGVANIQNYRDNINSEDYSQEDYFDIIALITKAINETKSVSDISEINPIFTSLQENVNKFTKIDYDKMELDMAITVAKQNLENKKSAIREEDYETSDYTKCIEIINKAIDDITKCGTIDDVKDIIDLVNNDIAKINKKLSDEEINDYLTAIEDDLRDILSLDGKTISTNLDLKKSSLHDSVIVWDISDTNIISSNGELASKVTDIEVIISYSVILYGKTYDGKIISVYVNTNVEINLGSYYNSIDLSKTGSQLKLALRSLITSTHKYKTSYNDLKTKTAKTDADPNRSGYIIMIYSRASLKATWDSGKTWNREHVWPQSQGWFSKSGAGSDIHHLRPETPKVNSDRGNKPFGSSNSSVYYCPQDCAKGDVARIIFYMLTRYSESDGYRITCVAQSMDLLLKWNELDPVDSWEKTRNEECYKIQGNRNPFIDYPDFANKVWDYSNATMASAFEDATIVQVTITYAVFFEDDKKYAI